MRGEILLTNSREFNLNNFDFFASPVGYGLEIVVDDQNTLENQLKNKKDFLNIMKKYLNQYENKRFEMNNEQIKKESIAELNYLIDNFDDILDKSDYIRLSLKDIDELKFISEHNCLKNKKIVLNEMISLESEKRVNELLEKYKDIKDNIYVILTGNIEYVSLSECKKTISEIKKMVKKIKKLNLSTLETIMYVYDIVRSRVYVMEEDDENKSLSRDLSKALLGDKIVCMGYSNILNAILNYLNISCNISKLSSLKGSGHARNVIYVQDDKYGIDGVYYFDATWDSKKDDNDKEYINKYKFFAKTKKYMDRYNELNNLYEEHLPIYDDNLSYYVQEILNGFSLVVNKPELDSINYMSKIIDKKLLFEFSKLLLISKEERLNLVEEYEEKVEELCDKFSREIPGEIMLQVLNRVRKIEYLQDSEKYSYLITDMVKSLINSNWNLRSIQTPVLTLINNFVYNGHDTILEIKKDATVEYLIESNIAREIRGTQLTKILERELKRRK